MAQDSNSLDSDNALDFLDSLVSIYEESDKLTIDIDTDN